MGLSLEPPAQYDSGAPTTISGPKSSGRTAASMEIAQPAWQLPMTTGLGLGVACDHLFQETRFGVHHVGQGLAFFGLRAEGHEVHRVPGTQRHAHFGILA
jgi:hypothetical protein